jgi:hypothetical protein
MESVLVHELGLSARRCANLSRLSWSVFSIRVRTATSRWQNATTRVCLGPPDIADSLNAYPGGWRLRREGNGRLPPTMIPGPRNRLWIQDGNGRFRCCERREDFLVQSARGERCSRLFDACAGVPHSTEKTMSRGQFSRTIRTIRCQSSTPSPQAQPTGVPVTLPRSASE